MISRRALSGAYKKAQLILDRLGSGIGSALAAAYEIGA